MPRVISVGRLDLNSEGLLLLTNDGELARRLELPSTGWVRRYRVRVHGEVDQTQLAQLAKGITVEGVRYGGIEATFDRKQGDNVWLTMALTEGKNREIRNICGHFGWPVSRLIRIAYGPFQLGSHLNPGDIEEVPAKVLREQVGANQVHKVSGQLKLKQTPHGERARDKPRTDRPRSDKSHADKPRGEPRHKPKRHAH
jgi:23S rRNA pseudouridine2605 synthase